MKNKLHGHVLSIFICIHRSRIFMRLLVRMSISLSKAGTGDDLCESKLCNYLQIHQAATLLLGKIGQIGTTFKAGMWLQLISYEFRIPKNPGFYSALAALYLCYCHFKLSEERAVKNTTRLNHPNYPQLPMPSTKKRVFNIVTLGQFCNVFGSGQKQILTEKRTDQKPATRFN